VALATLFVAKASAQPPRFFKAGGRVGFSVPQRFRGARGLVRVAAREEFGLPSCALGLAGGERGFGHPAPWGGPAGALF
jgi:hypothetical protein